MLVVASMLFAEVDDRLKKATDFDELHQRVLDMTKKDSEVLKELITCYDEDTKPSVSFCSHASYNAIASFVTHPALMIVYLPTIMKQDNLHVHIKLLVTTFLVKVRSKKKETNYLPDDLKNGMMLHITKVEKEYVVFIVSDVISGLYIQKTYRFAGRLSG